ncbi:MAG: rhodanese-like domain-containing protein [bacterium]|nr:rhodanese-like domain-containing protein [bacterium]
MKSSRNKLKKLGLEHKISLVLLVISLMLTGYILGTNRENLGNTLTSPWSKPETVSVQAFKKIFPEKSFTLINVHTPYEGEIPGTDGFIPYDEIPSNSGVLPEDKNAEIILYCKTGRMSEEAVGTVKKLGYTNVRHLKGGMDAWTKIGGTLLRLNTLEQEVVPEAGIELPIAWGDLGPKLIARGVIDLEKFKQAVTLTPEQDEILTSGSSNPIVINKQNSQFVVDLLWAIGLAQKSIVYDQGPMGTEYKDRVGSFASTGGWTLARGDATQYLNRSDLIPLTADEQSRVADISKNVYRPCCGNSTWFPDCNHGMAALAAIELMVSAGLSDQTIYRNVLALNSFWFPDSYLTVATFFARAGTPWKDVDPKLLLGPLYSSGQGAAEIAKKVGPLPFGNKSAGGCGA